jgi:hypothetical protein
MNSAAHAIAWELWRRNRWGNRVCLGVMLAFALGARGLAWRLQARGGTLAEGSVLRPACVFVCVLAMMATFVWLCAVFGNAVPDRRRGFSGIPPRMFTLPLRTSYLVGCLMAYGVLGVGLAYAFWAIAVLRPVGLFVPLSWPLLGLAVAMLFLQAAVWGLASFPWIRIAVISGGLTGLVIGLAWAVDGSLGGAGNTLWLHGALTACGAVAFGAAVLGVNAERHGGWDAWASVRPHLRKVLDALPLRRWALRTPAQAQFWFEWRRKGWFLACGLALTIAGSVLVVPAAALLAADSPLPLLPFLWVAFYPILIASTGGMALAKSDFWSADTTLQPFQAIRPLTDAELVAAKLKVVATVTGLGWLLAVPLVCGLMAWTRWREFCQMTRLPEIYGTWITAHAQACAVLAVLGLIAAITLIWNQMVAGLALGLTGRRRFITVRSITGLCLFVSAVILLGWLGDQAGHRAVVRPWLWTAATLLLGWKCLRALLVFRASFALPRPASRSSQRWEPKLLLGWIATAASVIAFFAALRLYTSTAPALCTLGMAWLLPGAEVPRCVTNLSGNRHR